MSRLYLDSGGAATNSGSSDSNSPDFSGTGTATIFANKTFVDGNVTVGADSVNVATHGFTTGSGIELTTTGVLPAGLTLTTLYYLRALDANNIAFYVTVADANADTNRVDITAAAGGGTHTINSKTIAISGGIDVSGVLSSHCRLTTTGTSHVISLSSDGITGLTTGDWLQCEIGPTGGALPTGMTNSSVSVGLSKGLYANALSSTTFRVYSTQAAAIAGGASDLNISAGANRSLYLRQPLIGPSIRVANSTVSNRKTFWIRGLDNTNDLIIVDETITLSASPSDWTIGGRCNAAGAADAFNALRGADEIIVNTDISANPLNLQMVQKTPWQGLANGGNPWIAVTGKAGARRVLTNQGNGVLMQPDIGNSNVWAKYTNIEFQSQGTGAALTGASNFSTFMFNCKITDSGANIVLCNNLPNRLVQCEFSGITGDVRSGAGQQNIIVECYFHDNTGINFTGAVAASSVPGSFILINNIFDRAGAQNIQTAADQSGGTNPLFIVYGNTIYRADNSGYEETTLMGSANNFRSVYVFMRNIFKDNGDAAGEANIEFTSVNPLAYIVDQQNCVNISGGRGGANTIIWVLDASDITTDPLFVDADNGSAASRDFNLQTGSPARGSSNTFTYLGSGTTTRRDLGASQHLDAGTGGSGGSNLKMGISI